MDGPDEPIDWGSWDERTKLAWAARVPKDQRGTPNHLRANLEFLWATGSILLVVGLLTATTHFTVLGVLGWFIGLLVAIRLLWILRTR